MSCGCGGKTSNKVFLSHILTDECGNNHYGTIEQLVPYLDNIRTVALAIENGEVVLPEPGEGGGGTTIIGDTFPLGGTVGQYLGKLSSLDKHVGWLNIPEVIIPEPGEGSGGTTIVVDDPTHFNTRAAAIAATVPVAVQRITVAHAGRALEYVRDTNGTALTTAGNVKWSPAEIHTPLHYGAMGDATTDDSAAIQAMFNFIAGGSANKATVVSTQHQQIITGYGKKYGIGKPIYIGNVGDGGGGLSKTVVQQLYMVALAGSGWTGAVAQGLSGLSTSQITKSMLVIAWRQSTAYSDEGTPLFDLTFRDIRLDANFVTGNLYIENTNSVYMDNIRLSRTGKNCVGLDTPVGSRSGMPLGVRIGNGACRIHNVIFAGNEEEFGSVKYPTGEDQDSMNTLAFRWRTNDAILSNWVINGYTNAGIFSQVGAVQVYAMHPWSRKITLTETARNIWFFNCYFDYTLVELVDEFQHMFVGCTWPLNDSARPAGLHLITSQAGTTGDKLVISGCQFNNLAELKYMTTGSGAWVAPIYRKLSLTGTHFDKMPVEGELISANGYCMYNTHNGAFHHRMISPNNGGMSSFGSFLHLGAAREAMGIAGIYMFNTPGEDPSAQLIQSGTTDNLFLSVRKPNATIGFLNNAYGDNDLAFEIVPRATANDAYNLNAHGNFHVYDKTADGYTSLYGKSAIIGRARTVAGDASLRLVANLSGGGTGVALRSNADGDLFLESEVANGEITLRNSNNGSGTYGLTLVPNATGQGNYRMLLNGTFSQLENPANGACGMYGHFLQLGEGRSSAGFAAIYMTNKVSADSTAVLQQTADNILDFGNLTNSGTFRFRSRTQSGASYDLLTMNAPTSSVPNGLSTLNTALSVEKNAAVKGTLTVTGATALNGGLTVVGGVSIPEVTSYITSTAGARFLSLNLGGGLTFESPNTYRINGMAAPVTNYQAANKTYVDSAVSDERVKENIQDPAENWGLDYIEQLEVKLFDYRCQLKKDQYGSTFGLLAQHTQSVAPELVQLRGREEIYPNDVSIDENGELNTLPVEVIEDALGIDYRMVVIPLLHAVQSLTAQVKELKDRIDTIEGGFV